ncbi:MAG: hypothetical protein IJJ17_03150 [Parasporobacterium sp.]|nr:hypothetical protein [Parasporobacterium sp.]
MQNKAKRILALIGIIILAGLYITTLLLAVFGNENTQSWFMASIACTVIVPIMLWVISWLYKMLKKDVSDSLTSDHSEEDQENQ